MRAAPRCPGSLGSIVCRAAAPQGRGPAEPPALRHPRASRPLTFRSAFGTALFHEPIISAGPDGLVLVRDITFAFLSERTLLPCHGRVHIAYVPRGGQILGLSKLARATKCLASRIQTQQRFAGDLLAAVQQAVQPAGAAVVVQATHMCGVHGLEPEVASACCGCFAVPAAPCMQELATLLRMSGSGLAAGMTASAPAAAHAHAHTDRAGPATEAMVAAVNVLLEGVGEDTARQARSFAHAARHTYCRAPRAARRCAPPITPPTPCERRAWPAVPSPMLTGCWPQRPATACRRRRVLSTSRHPRPTRRPRLTSLTPLHARTARLPRGRATWGCASSANSTCWHRRRQTPRRQSAAPAGSGAGSARSASTTFCLSTARCAWHTKAQRPTRRRRPRSCDTWWPCSRDAFRCALRCAVRMVRCARCARASCANVAVAIRRRAAPTPRRRAAPRPGRCRSGLASTGPDPSPPPCRGPQVQERLSQQVAESALDALGAASVLVVCESTHMCMVARGVEKHASSTVTTACRGGWAAAPAARAAALERLMELR